MPEIEPFYSPQPLVIAHRGASDVAPENTLAAFQAALEAGADGIELDVSRCGTGEIVVLHDDTLERTTDGSGRVDGMSFSALRALDAGAWFGARYAGERVPTLAEVLDLCGTRLRLNIEIKGTNIRSDGIESEIAALVRARGLAQRVILSSFNPTALMRAKRVAPELRRGLLYAPDLPIYLARAWSRHLLRPDALHPHYSMVDERMMAWARRKGYHVNVWTVDDKDLMRRMILLGVDGIITDHPAQLRALLR